MTDPQGPADDPFYAQNLQADYAAAVENMWRAQRQAQTDDNARSHVESVKAELWMDYAHWLWINNQWVSPMVWNQYICTDCKAVYEVRTTMHSCTECQGPLDNRIHRTDEAVRTDPWC